MSQSTVQSKLSTTREAPKLSGTVLLTVAFQTLGIIYSDIGTSPLYTLNGIWPASGPVPSEEDVIGGISAIIWSLTILPLLKYVFISLRFGTTEGEGGTFALYHGLFPPNRHDIDDDRTLTGDTAIAKTSLSNKTLKEKLRWPLLIWALFGTSLTMADGVFTPAVSVTSAVSGIAIAKESVSSDVVPISIAFLVALFLVQWTGTSRLAFTFAPIAFIWFCLLGGTGIANIVVHPGILRAFDPSRAVLLFKRTRDYDLLGGVLLAVTGCEALFANLGQFNAASIQIAFGSLVYPSLILAYLGQGARLIKDKEAVLSNIFYLTIPGKHNGPLFWIIYVIAVLATLIASQSMITATFSLVQQVVNMRSLPPIRMNYTSDLIQGQIYIPVINWILMAATVAVVGGFGSSTALTNAYGFAVTTVMFTTTALLAFQIRWVKHSPIIFALAFFIFFGFFDGLFWGAALKKVPDGAWVPLMLGMILLISMVFWTWAKGLEDTFDGKNRRYLGHFIMTGDDDVITASEYNPAMTSDDHVMHESVHADIPCYITLSNATSIPEKRLEAPELLEEKLELARIPTCAVFHKLTPGKGVPHSFIGFIRQWPALPRVVIFLSVHTLAVPYASAEDRYQVTKVRSLQGFYGVTYCLGYRDDFEVKVNEVMGHICNLEMQSDPAGYLSTVEEIRKACSRSTHIVPYYHVVSKPVNAGRLSPVFSWIRCLLIESIYRRLATMFPETANWLGSADEIIHVGVNAVI